MTANTLTLIPATDASIFLDAAGDPIPVALEIDYDARTLRVVHDQQADDEELALPPLDAAGYDALLADVAPIAAQLIDFEPELDEFGFEANFQVRYDLLDAIAEIVAGYQDASGTYVQERGEELHWAAESAIDALRPRIASDLPGWTLNVGDELAEITHPEVTYTDEALQIAFFSNYGTRTHAEIAAWYDAAVDVARTIEADLTAV